MAGWQVIVYHIKRGKSVEQAAKDSCASPTKMEDSILATWRTGPCGINWLDELVRKSKAVAQLSSGGYPWRYTCVAKEILPTNSDFPAEERLPPSGGFVHPWSWEDAFSERVARLNSLPERIAYFEMYPDRIAECRPNDELLIEAWDNS